MTMAELRAAAARYRTQAQAIGAALVVLVLSIGFGVREHGQVAPVRVRETQLRQSASEIASFRAAFRPATPDEDARLLLPDSLAVAIPHDLRMSLAGQLAARAQSAGLADVRVHFAPADSAAPPPRPDLLNPTVSVGDYTIAIDCGGSFAQLLSFVDHLPATAALQRMTASRSAKSEGEEYHLVFAVYEGDAPNSAGTAAAGGGQHG